MLKFGNFSKADSGSGWGWIFKTFHNENSRQQGLWLDRQITPRAVVDALDLYSLLIKVKERGLDMKCMHSENLGCISFLCRTAQWRYKEQSLVSNVHKHKLSLLRVLVSREYRMGSRRLWCQWCHLWADIPIMAWSMSHPPLSVIPATSWAGELFVFLLAASDIGRSGNQNTSQGAADDVCCRKNIALSAIIFF